MSHYKRYKLVDSPNGPIQRVQTADAAEYTYRREVDRGIVDPTQMVLYEQPDVSGNTFTSNGRAVGSVFVGERLWVAGGLGPSGFSISARNRLESWFEPTDRTTPASSYAVMPRRYGGAFGKNEAGTHLYYIGGHSVSGGFSTQEHDINEYDIAADTWTNIGTAPYDFSGCKTLHLNGLMYIINSNSTDYGVYTYDPDTGTFELISAIPGSTVSENNGAHFDPIYFDGSIYIDKAGYSTTVLELNLATETWTEHENALPKGVHQSFAGLLGNRYMVVGGGIDADGVAWDKMVFLDIQNNFEQVGIEISFFLNQGPVVNCTAQVNPDGDTLYFVNGYDGDTSSSILDIIYLRAITDTGDPFFYKDIQPDLLSTSTSLSGPSYIPDDVELTASKITTTEQVTAPTVQLTPVVGGLSTPNTLIAPSVGTIHPPQISSTSTLNPPEVNFQGAVEWIYYTTFDGTDTTVRKIKKDGTGEVEVVASMETAVPGVDFNGQGGICFVPSLAKIGVIGDNGRVYKGDLDGTNWGGGAYASAGHGDGAVVRYQAKSGIFVTGEEGEGVSIGDPFFGSNYDREVLSTIGGDTITGVAHDYINGFVYWSVAGDASMRKIADDGTGSTIYPNFGVGGGKPIDIDPVAVNADATVGRLFRCSGGSIYMYDLDVNPIATLDMTTVDAAWITAQVLYDERTDKLWMYRSDNNSFWTLPNDDTAVPGDAEEILTLSTAADGDFCLVHTDELTESYRDISEIGTRDADYTAADALTTGDAAATNGDPVLKVPDGSGNGNDMFNDTGSDEPSFIASDASFNGLPSVDFDGVNEYMELPDGVLKEDSTVFIVYESHNRAYFLHAGNHGDTGKVGFIDDTEELTIVTDTIKIGANTAAWGTPEIGVYRLEPDDFWARAEVSGDIARTAHFNLPDTATMNSPQKVGAREDVALPATTFNWNGEFARIIVYSGNLSNKEIWEITQNLKDTYNI